MPDPKQVNMREVQWANKKGDLGTVLRYRKGKVTVAENEIGISVFLSLEAAEAYLRRWIDGTGEGKSKLISGVIPAGASIRTTNRVDEVTTSALMVLT